MLKIVDRLVNGVTMYRLILWFLLGLVGVSIIFSFFGLVPFSPLSLIGTFLVLTNAAYFSNTIFGKILKAPINAESSAITALILFFVLLPGASVQNFLSLALIAIFAMASKYIFAFRKKHIFNPAAIGAVFGTIVLQYPAMWWVATLSLLPFAIVFGFLLAYKVRRLAMYFTFIVVALLTTAIFYGFSTPMGDLFISWPIFFLGGFMLTEPMTSPPKKLQQVIYAIIVGLLFGIHFRIGSFSNAPEVALLLGNIFAFSVSSKTRLMLKLKERKEVAAGIFHITFTLPHSFAFEPGQYLEWTLQHEKSDSRGWRRFFTIASSPTESEIAVGIKIGEKRSTFKNALVNLPEGAVISAGQLAGDFVLPKDPKKKLVFIAGGIGVTPFRSMIKYLVDKNEPRTATLFYSCMTPADFAYEDLFKEAEGAIGLKNIRLISDKTKPYPDFTGYNGFLTPEIIKREVPDYAERMFYLSGPNVMVTSYKKLLKELGVKGTHIKTDYFPGY